MSRAYLPSSGWRRSKAIKDARETRNPGKLQKYIKSIPFGDFYDFALFAFQY